MYDLPHGLQLSLPIADYYSLTRGRLEGVGVRPDVPTSGAAAMDAAFDRIATK
jgi:C-terminal processing protease CtpA/Prc